MMRCGPSHVHSQSFDSQRKTFPAPAEASESLKNSRRSIAFQNRRPHRPPGTTTLTCGDLGATRCVLQPLDDLGGDLPVLRHRSWLRHFLRKVYYCYCCCQEHSE